MPESARDRFLDALHTAVTGSTLAKLTLGKYRGADPALRNVFVRPVTLKAGAQLAFVWRYATRDVTKNLPPEPAIAEIKRLLGTEFLDAHLFTTQQQLQLETAADGSARLKTTAVVATKTAATTHDREKQHLIPNDAPWLRALGVTNERGQPREGMADKLRQIQKFAELLSHLIADAKLDDPATAETLHVTDMGSGKGYLTFAVAALLGPRARVHGVEARPELVQLCNRIARDHGFAGRLDFSAGNIADAPLASCDILIALHACDTATDDALARGVTAGARLLVVSPCCQKELRRQLHAPAVLSEALRHGIFQERQAEFVTDALRAQLLEWAGYRTKVFEFISTEHTAKNLMIAGIKTDRPREPAMALRLREFAAFYGIRHQALATQLGVPLSDEPAPLRYIPTS